MPGMYELLHIKTKQGSWPRVIEHTLNSGAQAMNVWGGELYGMWRSRIGLPLNEGVIIVHFPEEASFGKFSNPLLANCEDILDITSRRLLAAGRPEVPQPLTKTGVYMHRWFELANKNWEAFREITMSTWTGVHEHFESEIVGFWQSLDVPPPQAKALMITRYESLDMWERSRSEDLQTQAEPLVQQLVRRQKMVNRSFGIAMEIVPIDDSEKNNTPFV